MYEVPWLIARLTSLAPELAKEGRHRSNGRDELVGW
jgi:hypothetical protein